MNRTVRSGQTVLGGGGEGLCMPEPCWCKVLVMVQGLVSSSGAGDMLVEYMFYCSVSGQVESSTLNHEIF